MTSSFDGFKISVLNWAVCLIEHFTLLVVEGIRFMSNWNMYVTLSEGKNNNTHEEKKQQGQTKW